MLDMTVAKTHLWIFLNAFHRLVFRLVIPSRELRLNSLLLLLLNLTGILAIGIAHGCFVANVHTLVVLSHGKQCLRLAEICADELGIVLDGHVAVLDGRREREQLDEASGAI